MSAGYTKHVVLFTGGGTPFFVYIELYKEDEGATLPRVLQVALTHENDVSSWHSYLITWLH